MISQALLATLLMAAVVLLGAAGTVLYLASYFQGGLLILAALGVYLWRVRLVQGPSVLRELLRRWVKRMVVPLFGITAAILLGGVVMAVSGYNPLVAYQALFYGGLARNWHISVLNAAPLIFTALSVAFAFKAGLFNIGAEGQYYLGAMAAAGLSLYMPLPGVIALPLIFLVAGLFGALWNVVPAYLKMKTGAHEVITTMMLAHVARYLSPVFIRAFGGDPSTSRHPYVTTRIPDNTMLLRFRAFLPEANPRLHTGILLAILVALVVYYLLYKTSMGFEIRAVGENKDAARAQGISVGKNIFRALLIAGFLAALAGFNQVNGLDHRLYENLQAGYGWNGISVALLAGGHPIAVVFTGLLWGALDAGGQYMSRTTQTPGAIVEIVKGIILFLIVARYIYTAWGNRRRRREVRRAAQAATAAAGEEG
ncbi:nucleoside ABC transporter membrane protein [Alkalispirochaeta americana]|uniref:Nucleoside ABC transporter membrane protein n=1 Tax=Alkalispirochaeta americana TaxID=159291 RepID=A0A1N6RVN6_9SPIO|nr:ABC transporter permease [Alkalispirochaeta americana]SIQ32841.1 nucleoside ABC transporter membrane protein [Alkalispirochaeta americana]